MDENQFPREFYASIIDDLDEKLMDFYKEHQGEKYFEDSFFDFAAATLNEMLGKGYDSTALKNTYNDQKKQSTRKKKRWLSALKLNAEQIAKTADNYPFRNIVLRKAVLNKNEWKQLFGKKTVEDLIAEELVRADEWAKDSESYFIDFPALPSLTAKKIFDAFSADILANEFAVLKTKYPDLDLSTYTIKYIDELGYAAFTHKGKKKYPTDENDDYSTEIPMSEDGSEKLLVSVSREAFGDDHAITMLDDKDQRILFEVIKRTTANLGARDKTVLIELGELAKAISKTNKPTKAQYQDAEKRCYKIAEFTYRHFVDGEQKGAINFLSDAILQEHDGKKFMQVSLGNVLINAAENNMIRRLPSTSYDVLTNKTARILVLSMQRERIQAYARYLQGEEECATIFVYNDFLRMVNFGGNNKRKNMQTIKEALAEFKDKGINVKSFTVDSITNTVKVTWIPFTEDEWSDVAWYGYGIETKKKRDL